MSNVLLWIPARGGSKRIFQKNMQTVAGCTLVGRAVWGAREFRRLIGDSCRIVVDTDDEDIAEEGRRWGAEVPFLRESRYATDDSTSSDTLVRLLQRLEERGDSTPSSVVLLQTTSPLRTVEHMLDCWKTFVEGPWERLVSVRPAQVEYSAALVPDEGGTLHHAGSGGHAEVVCPSGAFYAVTVAALKRDPTLFLSGATGGVLVDDSSALDTDESYELEWANATAMGAVPPPLPCMVIAEAGVNHNGSLATALELVDVAAEAGADAVKFQTFDPAKLVTREARMVGYQEDNTGRAGTQWDLLQSLRLSPADHVAIQSRCELRGIRFLSTPFDEDSAELLVRIGVDILKIPSGEITNLRFLSHAAGLGLPIILSTGMSTLQEVADAVAAVRRGGCQDLTLLHCVSNYPTAPADANLRAMHTLKGLFDVSVGWSDHTLGINVALAAVAQGASVVEKHFTLSRELPGPDHRASLEPIELADLVRGVREVEASLGDGLKLPVSSELLVASAVRRSIHAARALPAGQVVVGGDLVCLRPGTGLSPARMNDVIGRVLTRALEPGEILTVGHLG